MSSAQRVERFFRRYRDGIYLDGELFLIVARNTKPEDVEEVLAMVPDDLADGFHKWVREYMLEGGIPVGSSRVEMPSKEVMLRFKAAVDSEGR